MGLYRRGQVPDNIWISQGQRRGVPRILIFVKNFLFFHTYLCIKFNIRKFLNISFFIIIAQSGAACQIFDNILSNNKFSRCYKNPPVLTHLLYIYQTQLKWVQNEAYAYFYRHCLQMPKKSPISNTSVIYISTAHGKGDGTKNHIAEGSCIYYFMQLILLLTQL